MSTYGRQVLESIGKSIQVTADGAPIAKAGGVTIDWSAVAAFAADFTFEQEDIVYSGEKFLRYGQIVVLSPTTGKYVPYASGTIAKGDGYVLNESVHENQPNSDHPPAIDGGRVYRSRLLVTEFSGGDVPGGTNEVQTITTGANNTGGSFTITALGRTTSALAFDASAAQAQSALEALSTVGAGNVTVTRSGSAVAGFVFTITFKGDLANENIAALTGTGSLTGGTNTVTAADVTPGVEGTATGFGAQPSRVDFEAAFPMITYVPEPNLS